MSKKTLTLTEVVKDYTPEGQNPAIYMRLIKQQVLGVDQRGNDRPNEDLIYFLYVAHKTGLDPLARQIYAVYRWDSRLGKEKMTIQTSIDGLRLVAQRSGLYGGQDDVVFDTEDADHPNKATVTVYRINPKTGERMPITASARWREYVQLDKKGNVMGMWRKMPYLMLGKVAEALALRKAFPAELSGLYTDEEMAQSSNPLADLPTPQKRVKPTSEHGQIVAKEAETTNDTKKEKVGKNEALEKPKTNNNLEKLLENKRKELQNAKEK